MAMSHPTFGDFMSELLVKLIVVPTAILLPLLALGQLMALQNSMESLNFSSEATPSESTERIGQEAIFQQ